tara:strand:+ start:124 stop:1344 length:1221 start_codon:yes stop_codon:yes gene_type:complete
MKIKKCRNCQSKNIKKVFSLGNIFYTGKFTKINVQPRKGPISVVICESCTLVQLENNFDLNYMYGKDYGYRTGINKTMTLHVKKIVKMLSVKTKIKKHDLALDIASNDGTLLNFYKNEITTFGIDPVIKKYVKNYKKINYKVSDFFSAEKVKKTIKKKFKIITALSVFYDLQNPNKFLKDVESILEDQGILVIEFADLASIIKFNVFDTFCHEHSEYYSAKVIFEMCKKNGLRIFDVKINDINGGSLQFLISKTRSKYKTNNNSLKKIFKREIKLKLDKKQTFFKFINRVNKIKFKLNAFIKKAIKEKKTIHGYGASTKGNVLLQYFGLTNKEITYIAERNPNKYNLYTPGSKIKIISEALSRRMKPDYYLVLPWHFKKEILLREKKILLKKTKFIFPLPNTKVIG